MLYPYWCPSLGINGHLSDCHSLCSPRPWRRVTATGLGCYTLGNEACSHCCEESQLPGLSEKERQRARVVLWPLVFFFVRKRNDALCNGSVCWLSFFAPVHAGVKWESHQTGMDSERLRSINSQARLAPTLAQGKGDSALSGKVFQESNSIALPTF